MRRAFDLASHAAHLQNIEVELSLNPAVPQVMADFDQLQQVCTNLVLNAVQAMPGGGRLALRTSASDGWLTIDIEDTGVGIPPENIKKLFTPFFTTKVKGIGLGLAVAYGIIQRHRGKIEVQSKESSGTTFTIRLPIQQPEYTDSSPSPLMNYPRFLSEDRG
jgi:two-component system NtrC family sensor kinase